jgi:hypothetical protein
LSWRTALIFPVTTNMEREWYTSNGSYRVHTPIKVPLWWLKDGNELHIIGEEHSGQLLHALHPASVVSEGEGDEVVLDYMKFQSITQSPKSPSGRRSITIENFSLRNLEGFEGDLRWMREAVDLWAKLRLAPSLQGRFSLDHTLGLLRLSDIESFAAMRMGAVYGTMTDAIASVPEWARRKAKSLVEVTQLCQGLGSKVLEYVPKLTLLPRY